MATFSPDFSGPRTLLQEAEGKVLTPYLPNSSKRVVLILSEGDRARYDALALRGKVTLTDQMTGQEFTVKRAACGLGCHCAAEIVS